MADETPTPTTKPAGRVYGIRDVARGIALFYALGLLLNAEGLSNWAARLRVSAVSTVVRQVAGDWASLTSSVGLGWPQKVMSDGFLAFAEARPGSHNRARMTARGKRALRKGSVAGAAAGTLVASAALGASPNTTKTAGKTPQVGLAAHAAPTALPASAAALASAAVSRLPAPTLNPIVRLEKEREMFDGAAIDDGVKGPKVLVLGDSIMITVGPVLRSEVAAKLGGSAVLKAKLATGLARPDVFDWTKELRRYTAVRRYDAMVVMLGTNDSQDFAEGDEILAYGTAAWSRVYGQRLDALMTTACEGADRVLWLGLPPMRSAAFNRKAARLNSWVKKLAAAHECVEYVPLDDTIGDDQGRYVTYRKVDRRLEKVRMTDGIHVTAKGGELVSRVVLPRLTSEHHVEAH